jgi:transposase
VRDIRRAPLGRYSAEEKTRPNRDCRLRGGDSVADLCRKQGINQNLY